MRILDIEAGHYYQIIDTGKNSPYNPIHLLNIHFSTLFMLTTDQCEIVKHCCDDA